jgi:hypothetical protein
MAQSHLCDQFKGVPGIYHMNPEFAPAQTSVPDWLLTYCRQVADVHYGRKLNRMYVHMLESFLAVEPWKANPPLEWRFAKIHRSSGGSPRRAHDLGWVPLNMLIPNELHDRIKHAIDVINTNGTGSHRQLSFRTFLFTTIYWWCTYVHPYKGPGLIEG